jgi:hypothetical protein
MSSGDPQEAGSVSVDMDVEKRPFGWILKEGCFSAKAVLLEIMQYCESRG